MLDNLQPAMSALGFANHLPVWDIILPIGISFYTFASLSYTIDVYRNEIRGDCGLLDYALFVGFFPHLVAGPIVRARLLLPQIAQPRHATVDQFVWGLSLTCIGLFAKVVLADSVFAPVVEQVYAEPGSFSALDTWAAVLGFTGQIYFDFSGYSLCAIGLALCFGFEFPDNFRYPYAARSFSDFWRRWHITLSSWLRDYLYIPLGGSLHGNLKTYRNLMLTMLIGGLWHGASWNFVIWGGLHGTYLAAERWLRDRRHTIGEAEGPAIGATLLVFFAVTLTWIPFRAQDLGVATRILSGLFDWRNPHHVRFGSTAICYAAITGTILWQFFRRDSSLEQLFGKLNGLAQTS